MIRRVVLLVALHAPAARADVSTPSEPRAGETLSRACTPDEWRRLERALVRFCARRRGDDDCAWARRDLERPNLAERCTVVERSGARYRLRVQPDCWSWHLDAVRGRGGFVLEEFGISVGACD